MQYEVEIKSLLGSEENALQLKNKLSNFGAALVATNKQLNHYFVGGDLGKLVAAIEPHLSASALTKLRDLAKNARDYSLRTREKDGVVLLVAKVSVGADSSSNGVARMEFEEKVDLSLEDLDQLLLNAGFEYQAKWSREREEYVCKDVAVCLDRNAGYGWLAEFERVVDDESKLHDAENEVRMLMEECGVQELPQDRLERMFAFYNAHWSDYYGTDKVFTIA